MQQWNILSSHTYLTNILDSEEVKKKTIPLTGLGVLQGCEMLRILHCLDKRLTNGGKIILNSDTN
jgi:hypothetical protein